MNGWIMDGQTDELTDRDYKKITEKLIMIMNIIINFCPFSSNMLYSQSSAAMVLDHPIDLFFHMMT